VTWLAGIGMSWFTKKSRDSDSSADSAAASESATACAGDSGDRHSVHYSDVVGAETGSVEVDAAQVGVPSYRRRHGEHEAVRSRSSEQGEAVQLGGGRMAGNPTPAHRHLGCAEQHTDRSLARLDVHRTS